MREQHVLGQLALEGIGPLAGAVNRRVDQPGQNGVDPDADDGQVAGHRQRQADDAALGGRVGRLADLAVLGRHRRGVDDGAAGAVRVGLVEAHFGGGQPDAVERADQVDLDDAAVGVEVVGRGVVAVPADGPGGPTDAGAVDQRLERRHLDGRVDRGDDLLGLGDVGLDEQAAELLGQGFTLVRLEVGHDDADAALGQQPRRWPRPSPEAPPVTIADVPFRSMISATPSGASVRHPACGAEDRGWPRPGHICSGASMPSNARPCSSTRAVRSHRPSRDVRTASSSTRTRQAS